ncbi:MAG: zinc-binding alcohol dehydrogenase family protein [Burkholderiaceae bacterium]|jgi:NADPH2:quinone reductase|nr:zinc-binding alcohol dehydrogenase family protein [Burkholderiaceae bacterium]
MKAAIVKAPNSAPVYGDFAEPVARDGLIVVDVKASAMSNLTKARAAGAHYSSDGQFPVIAGIDGVGVTAQGQRVYFARPEAPFGALAERALVDARRCITLPDGLDDATAAAIAIPGMSSWAALTERARFQAGQTVLINGATGASGRLAVQIAKHLGARRVIATGRHATALESLKRLGADTTIALEPDEASLIRAFAPVFHEGVDVALDYLWGTSARVLLIAAARASAQPVCFVQIGSISGDEIALPGAVLRAAPITLLGSGIGSISLPRLCAAVQGVFQAAAPARLEIATQAVPLSALAEHWTNARGEVRTVFTIGSGQ